MGRPVVGSFLAYAAASDWLDYVVVEVSVGSGLSEASSCSIVRTVHIRTCEWHHEVFNVCLTDTVLLLHLLE